MLTKIGVAALLGTLGTVVGGTASAAEPCRTVVAPVAITAPVAIPVSYGYRHDRREDFARLQRQRREAAFRHAEWLHQHQGLGYRR
jgi:hypothetical protein